MKRYLTLFVVLAALGLGATAAAANDFGDMIARTLCHTLAASITLSDADSARYDAASVITGQYITMESTKVITARFGKRDGSASCERSVCKATELNCPAKSWAIEKNGNVLKNKNSAPWVE